MIHPQLWESRIMFADTNTQRPASESAGAWQSHNRDLGTKALESDNP